MKIFQEDAVPVDHHQRLSFSFDASRRSQRSVGPPAAFKPENVLLKGVVREIVDLPLSQNEPNVIHEVVGEWEGGGKLRLKLLIEVSLYSTQFIKDYVVFVAAVVLSIENTKVL